MAYVDKDDVKSKADLKRRVQAGEKFVVFQPGGIFPLAGGRTHVIEGPHYPKPHRWYAQVEIDPDTKVVLSVK